MYKIEKPVETNFIQKRRLEETAATEGETTEATKKTTVREDPALKPILMTGNGIAGFMLAFFTIYLILFIIGFLRDIFVSQQLVRNPLYVGKTE